MLSAGDRQKVRGGFEQVVSLLGVTSTWSAGKAT